MTMRLTDCRFRCGTMNLIENNRAGTYSFIGCILDKALPAGAAYGSTSGNVVTTGNVATHFLTFQYAACPPAPPTRSVTVSPLASFTIQPTPTMCAAGERVSVVNTAFVANGWSPEEAKPCVHVLTCSFDQCRKLGGNEKAGGAIYASITGSGLIGAAASRASTRVEQFTFRRFR